MKKFQFKLQKLLDYRESIEEKLLGELGVLRAQHETEQKALVQAVSLHDSYRNEVRNQLSHGDVEDIKAAHRYMNELANRVTMQEQRVRQIEKLKDKKTEEVVEASKDRKVLERLRELKMAEYKSEAQHDEQKFLDDLASIRFNRASSSVSEMEVQNEPGAP